MTLLPISTARVDLRNRSMSLEDAFKVVDCAIEKLASLGQSTKFKENMCPIQENLTTLLDMSCKSCNTNGFQKLRHLVDSVCSHTECKVNGTIFSNAPICVQTRAKCFPRLEQFLSLHSPKPLTSRYLRIISTIYSYKESNVMDGQEKEVFKWLDTLQQSWDSVFGKNF